MTDEELFNFLKDTYHIEFPKGYVHFANNFKNLDSGLKSLQKHHICPKCCGGDDNPNNLIKVSLAHHRKLHQLILLTNGLNEEQRNKLKFAYKNMQGKH